MSHTIQVSKVLKALENKGYALPRIVIFQDFSGHFAGSSFPSLPEIAFNNRTHFLEICNKLLENFSNDTMIVLE